MGESGVSWSSSCSKCDSTLIQIDLKFPRFVGTIFSLYSYEPVKVKATIYVGDDTRYENNPICREEATLDGSYECMKQGRYVHVKTTSLTVGDDGCEDFCLGDHIDDFLIFTNEEVGSKAT